MICKITGALKVDSQSGPESHRLRPSLLFIRHRNGVPDAGPAWLRLRADDRVPHLLPALLAGLHGGPEEEALQGGLPRHVQ